MEYLAAIAGTPGPPLATVAMNLAPAVAPAGLVLFILALLGGVVILVARDTHQRSSSPAIPGQSEITPEEEERLLCRSA